MSRWLLVLGLTLAVPSLAHADLVAPGANECNDKPLGGACQIFGGGQGVCRKTTCSKLDYSQGVPPKSKEYDCVRCLPGTPAPKPAKDAGVAPSASASVTASASASVAPAPSPAPSPSTPTPAAPPAAPSAPATSAPPASTPSGVPAKPGGCQTSPGRASSGALLLLGAFVVAASRRRARPAA